MLPRLPLLVLLVWFANGFLVLNAQGQTTTTAIEEDDEPQLDLAAMSDNELERICLERGFELVRDYSQGGELTHDDYVDAAKRCLALEQDMNEILEQNPDLAEELVAEIDRMKEEKEHLVAEQKEMLAQKESLEQQLAENNKQDDGGGEGSRMWGSALDGTLPLPQQSTSTTTTSSSSLLDNIRSSTMESAYDTYQGSTTPGEDPCAAAANSSSAVTQEDPSNKSTTVFSLKGFLKEVLTEFEKDVTRMTSLLLPVLKPIYKSGSKAWNCVKWMFKAARQHYQKYQPKQQQQQQKQSYSNKTNDPLRTH